MGNLTITRDLNLVTSSALQSIATLSTTGNEMLYITAPDTYITIPVSTLATEFLSQETSADSGTQIYGNLSVGIPLVPKSCSFGGGNAFVNNMYVRETVDNVAFQNYDTQAATSAAGTEFPAFPSVSAPSILYIGTSLNVTFPGIKFTIGSTAPNFTGGSYTVEYSKTGGTWGSTKVLVTQSNAPYLPTDTFVANTEYHVRFGLTPGWVQQTVNTVSAFWIRFSLVGTITTVGTLNQIKLHTDRTKINSDGFVEYFGRAQPIRLLPDFAGRLHTETKGTDPTDASLYVSKQLKAGLVLNSFASGENIGFFTELPPTTNTAYPLILRWRFRPAAAGLTSGWAVRYGFSSNVSTNAGSVSDIFGSSAAAPALGPNEKVVDYNGASLASIIVPSAGTLAANKLYGATALCDISAMTTTRTYPDMGDVFWFYLGRTADGNTNRMSMLSLTLSVALWGNGGYSQI